MKKLFRFLFRATQNRVERFGYPIVLLTAPKGGINFKVDLKDPNFNRRLSELTKDYSKK